MKDIKNLTLQAGQTIPGDYKRARAVDLVGARVVAVATGDIEGQYGDEPCTVLMFDNMTFHTFVHPAPAEHPRSNY